MKNRNLLWMSALFLVLGTILSYEVMLWFVDSKISPSQSVYNVKDDYTDTTQQQTKDLEGQMIPFDDETIEIVAPLQENEPIRIGVATKIVYHYYYAEDQKTLTDISEPSQDMLNLTRQELEAFYQDWEVFSFSKEQVVLKTTIEDKHLNGYYIIREYKGYITVFYNYTEDYELALSEAVKEGQLLKEDEKAFFDTFIGDHEEKYIREVLDTPINLLSEDEQNRLKEGIQVYGDEELMRLLENYSS